MIEDIGALAFVFVATIGVIATEKDNVGKAGWFTIVMLAGSALILLNPALWLVTLFFGAGFVWMLAAIYTSSP